MPTVYKISFEVLFPLGSQFTVFLGSMHGPFVSVWTLSLFSVSEADKVKMDGFVVDLPFCDFLRRNKEGLDMLILKALDRRFARSVSVSWLGNNKREGRPLRCAFVWRCQWRTG